MSVALDPAHPLGQSVRDIAAAELGAALDLARDTASPEGPRIHQIRLHCKKARALLRLIGPGFRGWRAENAAIRDAAARLGPARDDKVRAKTLEALLQHAAPVAEAARGHPISQEVDEPAAVDASLPDLLAQFARDIEPVVVRALIWPLDSIVWCTVVAGAKKTYRRAREAMHAAERSGAAADLHEWRKEVKYHRHQMSLLRRSSADRFKPRRAAAKGLAAALGEHHDIAVLAAFLGERMDPLDGVRARLLALAAHRQSEIVDEVFEAGRTLFEASPKAFARELAALGDCPPGTDASH